MSTPHKERTWWDVFAQIFLISSEIANVGIFIGIIAEWVPSIMYVLAGTFKDIAIWSDPCIYFLKSLNRLTRALARLLGFKLGEEPLGYHEWQTPADLFSSALFILAGCFLAGVIANPFSTTIGWVLGLTSLCVWGYFEHYDQEQRSKREFERLNTEYTTLCERHQSNGQNNNANVVTNADVIKIRIERDNAYKDHVIKLRSRNLFIALLIGLTFFLLCSSIAAAPVCPPVIIPVLAVLSKISSVYLALIAVGRGSNYLLGEMQDKGIKNAKLLPGHENHNVDSLVADEHELPREAPLPARENNLDTQPPPPPVPPANEEVKERIVRRAITQYESYKSGHVIGFFRRLRSSDSSTNLVNTLKHQLDTLDSPIDFNLIQHYLNNTDNIERTFYVFLNNELKVQVQDHTVAPSM